MPVYQYKTVTPEGEQTFGTIEAASRTLALEGLEAKGEIPLQISEKSENFLSKLNQPIELRKKISRADILRLTQELARLLKAGILVEQALMILLDAQKSQVMSELLSRIQTSVRDGKSLSDALKGEKRYFPLFYVQIVQAGEISGTLEDAFEQLSALLERQQAFRSGLISAMIYPTILLVLVSITLFIVISVVLPEFEAVFANSGKELPLATRVVMGAGNFLSQFGFLFLILIALAIFGGMRVLKKETHRLKLDTRLIRVKGIGALVVKGEFALIFRNLGSMIRNGVPVPEASQLVCQTIRNRKIRNDLMEAFTRMKEGETLSRLFSAIPYVPNTAYQLLRVGEETGRLGPMMEEVATILEGDVETTLKRALSLFSPIMTLGMGALIAAIIGAVLLGIMSINEMAF